MKKYFVLIGLFLGCLILASGYPRTIETQILPSATSGWDESIDNWRPIAVDSNGKLITGSGADSANIASIAIDTNNVASNAALLPNIDANIASIAIDTNNVASNAAILPNIDANIASIAIDTKQCSQFKVQVVTLTANTSHLLVSGLNGDRKFVEIKSHLPNQQFWVSFTNTAAVNLCRPCTEYFYAEVPSNVDVAIIASSAMTLSVVEGGL